jgi:uncharacterized repeat protein (TIGR01451 family)
MKQHLSYVLGGAKKKLAAAALVAMAVVLPVATIGAAAVQIEGSIGVANVTAGDTLYKQSVNASFDQVVKFQVYYHNMENPDSGKIAEDLRVKIAIPSAAGTSQKVRATVAGTNTNTIDSVATVNLNRNDAMLSYIPGSAVWKHNKGTNEAPQIVEEKISDAVVTSGQGLVLEDAKPCYNFDATVTVLARVTVPNVQVDKYVRVKGQTEWVKNNTAKPGETLEYQIAYKNAGNTPQNKVVIGDNLPPKLAYVPGSTYLKNTTNPNGVKYNSDNIVSGGIVVGDYLPGGAAYVKFDVKIPEAKDLACGKTEFRNVGIARPEGMNEFYNTAITTVERVCEQSKPVYSCDALTVASLGGRKVRATVAVTANNGATFKDVTFNFGDGSQKLITTNKTVEYTYTKDGTYTISAVPSFNVDGKTVTDVKEVCTKQVTFKGDKPVPPVTPPTTPPTIPNTGAGSMLGMFAGVSAAGALGHRVWAIRRNR